jgi:hypothetical protein
MRTVYHNARTLALDAVATGRHGGVPGKHRSRDRGGAQGRIGKVNYCFGNDAETLKNEYLRDVGQGLHPHVPENYFPDDDPTRPPLVNWRGHANLLYMNWLNYFVYQSTPYDIETIQPLQ